MNRSSKHALVVPALAALTAIVAASALAINPTETVRLKAVDGSGITGTAVAGAKGSGTRVVFTIKGLKASAAVRAVFHAGTCARSSASFANAGNAAADASGTARWTTRILFHGQPVAWSGAADGGHTLTLISGGRVVACGTIPGMS
jgi:hypothetical protein